MITLEKLLTELKAESLNEIIAGSGKKNKSKSKKKMKSKKSKSKKSMKSMKSKCGCHIAPPPCSGCQ